MTELVKQVENKNIQKVLDGLHEWKEAGCRGVNFSIDRMLALSGYASEGHLFREFSRVVGTGPRDYLNALAGPVEVRWADELDRYLTSAVLSMVPTAQNVARRLNVSTSTLTKACGAVYGMPFSEYLLKRANGEKVERIMAHDEVVPACMD